jgi:AAA domain
VRVGPSRQREQKTDDQLLEFESITPADLESYPEPEYLIDGIPEVSQPGVIAGQYKSLKTTIALELSYCLTTGHSFLGVFEPNRAARCGMFSGEAGPPQIRKARARIAAFHGDHEPEKHATPIFSCERLPKIGDPKHMEALKRWIGKNRLELAIIDPGYAALAAIGDGAGNYYRVADLLFQVTELQRETGCVMPICPHMVKAAKYEPPMLSDIMWSGFAEWSGQWLLLGKRREWDDQTGKHWLWLVVGGRSGHAATIGLDVLEGRQSDPGGKVFVPTLVDKRDAFTTSTEAQNERKQQQQTREQEQAEQAIRDAFRARLAAVTI